MEAKIPYTVIQRGRSGGTSRRFCKIHERLIGTQLHLKVQEVITLPNITSC